MEEEYRSPGWDRYKKININENKKIKKTFKKED